VRNLSLLSSQEVRFEEEGLHKDMVPSLLLLCIWLYGNGGRGFGAVKVGIIRFNAIYLGNFCSFETNMGLRVCLKFVMREEFAKYGCQRAWDLGEMRQTMHGESK
jgi:hypothetical protein